MPVEPLIEARIFSLSAEVLDLRQHQINAESELEGLLDKAPAELVRAIRATIKDGFEKLERRAEPPDLHQLMILIAASPGCSTKHLADQTYGSTDRLFTERIRARLNHCVGAGLLEKDGSKRGAGWLVTELGRERIEDS